MNILGFDKKISSTLNLKSSDCEQLSSTISNLEAKYIKLKEAYDEGKRVAWPATDEMHAIKNKISNAKDSLKNVKASHDLYISMEVQRIKKEKSKALELKKLREEQIEGYEKKLDPFAYL